MDVAVFEEHSSVLPEWWRREARGRCLVYFDAHLDLQETGPERLDRLRRCRSSDEAAGLEKAHHLLPDGDSSFGLEDWLFPAHRLGFVDRIVWVAPPHVEVGYSDAALSHLQQMDGVTFDEVTGFERGDDGGFRGRLLGIELCICRLEDLPSLGLPEDALVDVDADFFLSLPDERAWTSPESVVDSVRRAGLRPELVTISRSVGSGFLPLRHRFLADHLRALWEGRAEEAARWSRLLELDRRVHDGADASADCRREVDADPGCAAAWQLLARAVRDRDEARRHRERAGELDPAYRDDLLRTVGEFQGRQLPVDAPTVRSLERRLEDASLDARRRALVHAGLGLIWCAGGNAGQARRHLSACVEHLGAHPELALELGRLAPAAPGARELLESALADDKTRTAAHVALAVHHARSGSPARALEHVEEAHRRAPAWTEVLSLLGRLLRTADPARAGAVSREVGEREARLKRLAARR